MTVHFTRYRNISQRNELKVTQSHIVYCEKAMFWLLRAEYGVFNRKLIMSSKTSDRIVSARLQSLDQVLKL
jgi:hypothetical protein